MATADAAQFEAAYDGATAGDAGIAGGAVDGAHDATQRPLTDPTAAPLARQYLTTATKIVQTDKSKL